MSVLVIFAMVFAGCDETNYEVFPTEVEVIAGQDGTDGVDGVDGTDGTDGTDGVDGICPDCTEDNATEEPIPENMILMTYKTDSNLTETYVVHTVDGYIVNIEDAVITDDNGTFTYEGNATILEEGMHVVGMTFLKTDEVDDNETDDNETIEPPIEVPDENETEEGII